MSRFGVASTSHDVMSGVDLQGKVAIVTGASGGLGAETARALSAAGAQVTIVARNIEKANSVADAIRKQHLTCGVVDVMEAELADPESVRRFGEKWAASGRPLDLLFLNAGVMATPLTRTKEGWEMQFATNHLGHFLLTSCVAPSLRRGARVIVTSSDAHQFAAVDLDDLHFQRRPYTPWTAYGQSKTANIMFADALDRRLRPYGIRSFSCHPGMIMTDLARHMNEDTMAEMSALMKTHRPPPQKQVHPAKPAAKKPKGTQFKTIPAGAATQLWVATAKELDGVDRAYCFDCAIGPAKDYAIDVEVGEQLWEVSERLLGCKFPVASSKL